MPEYLIHKRGRGRLYGDAEANLSTYISRNSIISGFAKLRDCELHDSSQAAGHCQIYGGKYYASSIIGQTICAGSPDVSDSILNCSEVSGQSILDHVHAVGGTEICDTPTLVGTADLPLCLSNAIIYGSPHIHGDFTVTGRVHEGHWTRPPKYIKLPWCDLSECVVKNGEQHVLLDCRCRSVSYWLNHGAKLARRWLWSDDMISVTIDTIRREFVSVLPPAKRVVGAASQEMLQG